MSQVHILNFHGIGSPPDSVDADERRVWITVELFEEIIKQFGHLADVEFTFDDGNVSDFSIALPVLARHRLRGNFFIVTNRIDQPGYLSRSQITEMAQQGMLIGSHGQKHISWRGLNSQQLLAEVDTSKKVLEDLLCQPVTCAACPFGSYDRKVLAALKTSGYSHVYTSDRGSADSAAWFQPRNTIHAQDSLTSIQQALDPLNPVQNVLRSLKLLVKQWR